MISKIKGILDHVSESVAIVDVNGIYYEIMIPSALSESLRNSDNIGKEITFNIIDYIEGGQVGNQFPRLIGFETEIDRAFFSVFTGVPGLGIKKALKSLIVPINEISRAIEGDDVDLLKKLPGIGPRLAEKIIAELKGKTIRFALAKEAKPLAKPEFKSDIVEEALAILIQLQYKRNEAKTMLDRAIGTGKRFKSSEELLQQVFRQSGPEIS